MHLHFPSPRILALVACLVLTTVPFLFVTLIPVTDLPQQLVQARLFWETLGGAHQGQMVINWWSPNSLAYLLLVLGWKILPTFLLGKICVLILALGWVAAVHHLAKRRNRSIASTVFASVFVFNLSLYWGLLGFMLGWPLFVLWLTYATNLDDGPLSFANGLKGTAILLVLLLAHALWFLVGVAALVLLQIMARKPLRVVVRSLVLALPAAIAAAFWFPHIASTRALWGFDNSIEYSVPIIRRLSSWWVVDASLGGLRSPLEFMIVVSVILWIVMGILMHRRTLATSIDFPMGILGLLFILFSFLGPEKFLNTILFSVRWFPIGLILILLAAPPPTLLSDDKENVADTLHLRSRALLPLFTLAIMSALAVSTAVSWRTFEYAELYGLRESLDVIPDGSSVLGLDFIKTSAVLKGRPFLQDFAYAQALHGGSSNFSFAWHQSGIVADTCPWTLKWTPGLEWNADSVKASDVKLFDVVLVNGSDATQDMMAESGLVKPLSFIGRWRAYKTLPPSNRQTPPSITPHPK